MGEVQVWGRGMCVGSLNCGESWFLVPLSSESSALAVYLKLLLSHAQRKISLWSEEVWWQKKGQKNVYGVGACVIVYQAEQG